MADRNSQRSLPFDSSRDSRAHDCGGEEGICRAHKFPGLRGLLHATLHNLLSKTGSVLPTSSHLCLPTMGSSESRVVEDDSGTTARRKQDAGEEDGSSFGVHIDPGMRRRLRGEQHFVPSQIPASLPAPSIATNPSPVRSEARPGTQQPGDVVSASALASAVLAQNKEFERRLKEEMDRAYRRGVEDGRQRVGKDVQGYISKQREVVRELSAEREGVLESKVLEVVSDLESKQFTPPQKTVPCLAQKAKVLKCYEACAKVCFTCTML